MVQNEFIKLVVNNGIQDNGRFAIETTGGDPINPDDDNKSLIYGRPIPWTSYTTIKINNQEFIFGGPSIKLAKRSNKDLKYGTFISQIKSNDTISTVYDFTGIRVTQILSPMRNPTSKVKDTCRIEYRISNISTVSAQVGVRLMLDTKLGDNDASPFRIGDKAITGETRINRSDTMPFWQAFDSVKTPKIIAQGLLESPDDALTPPDTMFLSNWGNLCDSPWTPTYLEGRSFKRDGEEDNDTALAMYWDPVAVRPNQTVSVATAYGLGGLSIAAGDLSLGLTAPADAVAGSHRELYILAYITNSSGFISYDTTASLELPKGFGLTSGKLNVSLGTLKVGETRQIPFKVKPLNASAGTWPIVLRVTSSTLASNHIQRLINVQAPRQAQTSLTISPQPGELNQYVTASLVVKNENTSPVESVTAVLSCPRQAWFETPTKSIPIIPPGKTVTLNWAVGPLTSPTTPITVSIQSLGTDRESLASTVTVPRRPSAVSIEPSRRTYAPGDYGYVTLIGTPGATMTAHLSVSGDSLIFLRVTPDDWYHPTVLEMNDPARSLDISLLSIPENRSGSILRWHFWARKEGETRFIITSNGTEVSVPIIVSKSQPKESSQ